MVPWKCLPSAPRALCQERREKMAFPRQPFSLFFFELFGIFWCCPGGPEFGIEWARLPFFFWVLDLVDGFWAFLFTFWLLWTTGFDGPWTPGRSLGCCTWFAVDRKNGPLHLAPRAQIARDVWFGQALREIYAFMHVIVFLFPLFFLCTWVLSFVEVVADGNVSY